MPHAHHFLDRLDRITRAQTEFALALYRDHEAVRYVLDHVRLPPEAERVAIAIEDPREGPFVLVTRDGKFVTCLGAGMRHDHPVVPRPQVDALLAKVSALRARREMAARDLRPEEDEDDVVLRVAKRGSRLSREDFVAVSAFQPLIAVPAWNMMRTCALDAAKSRMALLPQIRRGAAIDGNAKMAKALEAVDRLEWAAAHLTVLACAGERRELDAIVEACQEYAFAPMYPCALQGGLPFFMRSAWAAARLGRGILPRYERALAEAGDITVALDAALGLGAIALRHAGTAGDVERILRAHGGGPGEATTFGHVREWAAYCVARVLEGPDHFEQTAMGIGRTMCVKLGESLPAEHALRFERDADVPDDLARTLMLWLDVDTWHAEQRDLLFTVLPLAARAAAEDFFPTREALRAWAGRWSPSESAARIERLTEGAQPQQPVRAEKVPGRNDPCTCGSGKKWKRCHGAPARA